MAWRTVLAMATLAWSLGAAAQGAGSDPLLLGYADGGFETLPDAGETLANMNGVLRQITRSPVSFIDAGFPLGDVQGQLEFSLGVPLTLTGGASGIRYRGKISGDNGVAFIESLAAKLNLDWAVGRSTIYLSPEGATETANFDVTSPEVGYRIVELARRSFEGMGSNIQVMLRQGQVSVTGIPAWVDNVATVFLPALIRVAEDSIEVPDAPVAESTFAFGNRRAPASRVEEPMIVMVFRLNNAYVDDKSVNVGSNTVTFPGVGTLFRRFTGFEVGTVAAAQTLRTSAGNARVPRLDPLAGERRPLPEAAETREPPAVAPALVAANAGNGPSIIADPRTNSLIVRDKASMHGPYTELIKILDQPVEMVQLDAYIMDIKASRFSEFGLALSWTDASLNSPNFAPGGSVPSGANLILQATEGAKLLALVRALETEGESQVLTVPSVVTQNNLEASFSARESFFVRVSGNLDASLTEVTAETLLSVTPLVEQAPEDESGSRGANGLNRRIKLLINIQDGSVDATDSSVVDSLPRTLENQITTQAVVRGGETLVIGGQVVRKEVSSEAGLPIIRNLPLLGTLTNSRSNKTEEFVRVYVVRPRILIEDAFEPEPESTPEPAAVAEPEPAAVAEPASVAEPPSVAVPAASVPAAEPVPTPAPAPAPAPEDTNAGTWVPGNASTGSAGSLEEYALDPGAAYTVRRSDTLWSIAERARVEGVTMRETMLEIQRQNPHAFVDGNMNQIMAGALIYLPSVLPKP